MRIIVLAVLSTVLASITYADCASPAGAAGSMYYEATHNVINFCDGTTWRMAGQDDISAGASGCTSPTGAEGSIIYNGTYNVAQFCNGDAWVNMGPEDTEIVSTSCSSPAQPEGAIIYNSDESWLQYCNGENWVNAGQLYLAAVASGFNWADAVQLSKVLASDGAASDRFGDYVSISGDTAIIGAYDDDDNGDGSGSAYIFIRSGNTWTQQAKLLPDDGAASDRFGEFVSISGDTVIIGAQSNSDNGSSSGSAYVFTRSGSTWTQQAKLLPDDGAASEYFGVGVSISSDTAVIGAYGDGDNGFFSGSVYVFTRSGSTWTQQAKLLPDDGDAFEFFGYKTAVSGDTTVIAAIGDSDNGSDSGSAYIFNRSGSTWTQQAKLLPDDGAANDRFGGRVSISGDTAIIGATGNDDNGDGSGSAYIFNRSGSIWTQQAKLLPDDGAAGDAFGSDVSISGNAVVVGAYADDDSGSSSGSVYFFEAE